MQLLTDQITPASQKSLRKSSAAISRKQSSLYNHLLRAMAVSLTWASVACAAIAQEPTIVTVVPDLKITPTQMIGWAAFICSLGGMGATLRTYIAERRAGANVPFSLFLLSLITVAVLMSVMGASVSMILYWWVADSERGILAVIGCSGILSLSGLASLDWVVAQFRKLTEKKINKEGERASK